MGRKVKAQNSEIKIPRTTGDRIKEVVINILRFIGLLACLYFFIISLDLMSSGFRLVAGMFVFNLFKIYSNLLIQYLN